MKIAFTYLATVATLLPAGFLIAADTAKKEARITRIIRDVQVLPAGAKAQPAVIDEMVQEDSGLRTGDESRSELTFDDLTITRLGANTIFSFNRAGRNAQLDSGVILVRVPKDSGGGMIKGKAVTVGITGTTVIFAASADGHSNLIVLEGAARAWLVKKPKASVRVLAGQMLDVNAGATKLPLPMTVDLQQIMNTNPLITDFPPLPSQDLIAAAIQNQQNSGSIGKPVHVGTPVGPGPVNNPGGLPTAGNPSSGQSFNPPVHRTPTPRPIRPRPTPTPRPKRGVPPTRPIKPKQPTPKPIRPVHRPKPTPPPPVIP